MAKRTIVYIRKSSKDKDERHQKYSLPRQKSDILDFVDRYNKSQDPADQLLLDEKDIVMEDASAKVPGNRPKFQEVIDRLKKGRYDVLLCTELSRLSRNAVDNGSLVQLLEPVNKNTSPPLERIQTKDKIFTTTPTDKFTLALFLSVSKFENDQRAENTKSGIRARKKLGKTTHRAPVGYINAGKSKVDAHVEKDPESWDSMRRLWELMMTGDYSIADIKREADELGVTYPTKKGRRMPTESTYRGSFCNKYYCGLVKQRDEKTEKITWGSGDHSAMVSEEEFEKIQVILQSRGYRHQTSSRQTSIEAILSEILVCGKCTTMKNGHLRATKMTYERKERFTCSKCDNRFSSATKEKCKQCGTPITDNTTSQVNRYYRCGKKKSSEACPHDFYGTGKTAKNIRAEDIEAYLDKHVSQLYITDELFEVLRRQLFTLWLKKHEALNKKIELLEDEKRSIREKRLNMRKKAFELDKELSQVAKEDTEFLLEENVRTEEDIEDQITNLREKEAEQFEKAWQSLNALLEAKSVFGEATHDIEPKRRLILSMVSNLEIIDKKWTINWKKPFDTIAKASIAKKGRPKSSTKSSDDNSSWLPRQDSNLRPIG